METCRSFCIWPLLSGLDRNVHKSAKYFAMLTKGKNALVVTTEDEVYGIGVNGDSCPLGVGSNGAIIQATKVKELSGKSIILICHIKCFIFAVYRYQEHCWY